MKIVHLYDGHEQIYEGQGSLPRIVWNVARRTADRGHDVTVLERQWSGLPPTAEHEGVGFRRLDLRTGSDEPWEDVPYEMVTNAPGLGRLALDRLNFAFNAVRHLRGIEYDVIHVSLPFAANVLVTVAPWLRQRMVYTAQLGELRLNALTDREEDGPDVPRVLQRFSADIFLARRAAYTTVLNENVKRIFAENGVPDERLIHVPNGVDVARFSGVDPAECRTVREKFGLEDEGPVLFFAGTVMPRKGVVQLVEAVGDVVNRGNPDLQLVIAGETDLDEAYTERTRSLISELEIEENVTFTGYLDDSDLLPLYRASDAFVLPSFEEGFGMVVSEAMAAGTPVVASDISGIRQQIDHGDSGLLVEPGDVDGLAGAIRKLVENPAKRRQMGERSERRAQRFSWETVTDQYTDVYADVVSRRGL
jgi:glycosyltransferase involved in cell wall biosynthesis